MSSSVNVIGETSEGAIWLGRYSGVTGVDCTDAPVIFMTGDRNIENITRTSEMGVDDYITKPFLPLAFKEILHSVLK